MELKDQSPSVPILSNNFLESNLYRRRHSHDKIFDTSSQGTFNYENYDNRSTRSSDITYYESSNAFDPDRKSKLWK